jgi:TrpR family trp operon transcriptional repressor
MSRNPELMRESIAEMARALEGADAALIEDFFYSLFTAAEADEMAKRWALVKELAKGIPQRKIAEHFNLSLCKITRGSRELKKPGSPFRQLLDKLASLSTDTEADHNVQTDSSPPKE